MHSEERQWRIQLVQSRYGWLQVDGHQAEQIHRYEEDNYFSTKHFFSVWEEWDYEQTVFQEILNDEQFTIYKERMNHAKARYEEQMVETDKERIKTINYYKEIITFYQDKILPGFLVQQPISSLFMAYLHDQSKVDFLRAEYKVFLDEAKKELQTAHFRHNRTYSPNQYKAELLRHKLTCLWPDFLYFQYKMDEPTKATVQYLRKEIRHYSEEADELMIKKLQEMREFNEANSRKYYGDMEGWHVIAQTFSPEEEKVQRMMTLLLFDKDSYGYK